CVAVSSFQVQPSGLFPLAIGELFVDAVFFCALSVALGAIMPPVAAGAGTVFAQLMPSLARPFLADPRPLVSWLALAGYYVGPAQMPVSLLGHSFAKELLNPSYGLYAQVLVENVLGLEAHVADSGEEPEVGLRLLERERHPGRARVHQRDLELWVDLHVPVEGDGGEERRRVHEGRDALRDRVPDLEIRRHALD